MTPNFSVGFPSINSGMAFLTLAKSEIMANDTIKIPEQLYLGISGGKNLDTANNELGFLTPVGTDSAFKNRKETDNRWAGRSHASTYEGDVLDNFPLEGFKI
jgi:hypothetical protein